MAANNGNKPEITSREWDVIGEVAEKDPHFAQLLRDWQKPKADYEPIKSNAGMPELPAWAQLPPGLGSGAGKWIDQYIDYARSVSPMTPRLFHESAALWLVSVAISRRLVLRMPHDDVYPNLYILWLAQTTLYRKSTSLNIGRKLAREVLAHLMAPQDTTPEALLSDMGGYQPANYAAMTQQEQQEWEKSRTFAAQKGLVYDEMSGLMAGAGKDYNAGLLEAFLRFYDCEEYFERSSRGQGRVVVKNAYLSILGSSTPSAMAPHFKAERLWGVGWWPRFAILTPEARPEWQEAQEVPRPEELTGVIRGIHNRLPCSKWPEAHPVISVRLGTGVHDAWNKYNKALSHELLTPDLNPCLFGTYGRLPTHALKVAMILAALDWNPKDPSPVIELPHMARAIDITETWRASAHRALELTTTSEHDRVKDRITRQLSKYPAGLTLRDLVKALKDIDSNALELAVYELVKFGDVEEQDAGTGAKGGRPTKRYILSKE